MFIFLIEIGEPSGGLALPPRAAHRSDAPELLTGATHGPPLKVLCSFRYPGKLFETISGLLRGLREGIKNLSRCVH